MEETRRTENADRARRLTRAEAWGVAWPGLTGIAGGLTLGTMGVVLTAQGPDPWRPWLVAALATAMVALGAWNVWARRRGALEDLRTNGRVDPRRRQP